MESEDDVKTKKPKKRRKYKGSAPWDPLWRMRYPATKVANWDKWREDNPKIFERFTTVANIMYSRGRRHYSAYTIFGNIRFEIDMETSEGEFKINNIHIPMFARLLIENDMKFFEFFKLCQIGDER